MSGFETFFYVINYIFDLLKDLKLELALCSTFVEQPFAVKRLVSAKLDWGILLTRSISDIASTICFAL